MSAGEGRGGGGAAGRGQSPRAGWKRHGPQPKGSRVAAKQNQGLGVPTQAAERHAATLVLCRISLLFPPEASLEGQVSGKPGVPANQAGGSAER